MDFGNKILKRLETIFRTTIFIDKFYWNDVFERTNLIDFFNIIYIN